MGDNAESTVSVPGSLLSSGGSAPSIASSITQRSTRSLLRAFRRSFLDQQDPFECTGEPQARFTFSGSYEIPANQSPQEVAEEIQAAIHESLSSGNLAHAELEMIDFKDAGLHGEAPRRFIVTRTITARGTPVTLYAYFRQYGQHLFYSVRSYAVPSLNGWKLLSSIVFFSLAFGPLMGLLGLSLFLKPSMGVFLFGLAVVTAGIVSRTFIRNVVSGDSVSIALRKQFPGAMAVGTFDDDDVIAFLKTNVALTLNTIARVLDRHGIETGTLRQIVQNLHTINIDTGGGGIVGAVFGGSGNHAFGQMMK